MALLSPSTIQPRHYLLLKKTTNCRIQNLELMVSNLLTRIVELEKTKYQDEILDKDWSPIKKSIN